MSRIPYSTAETQSAETQDLLSKLAPLNIFKMIANTPHALRPFVDLAGVFLFKGLLDPIGRDVGMDDALIDAVKPGANASGLTPHQSALIAFVDDLVANVRASDATFNPMLTALGPAATQELTLVTGFYMMVCRFLETFDVELEAGGAKGIETN